MRPETRSALDGVARAVGREVRKLDAPRVAKLEKLFGHLLGATEGESGHVGRGRTQMQVAHETARELASAVHLLKHFEKLEKTGGRPVERAEAKAFRFLARQADGGEKAAPRVRPSELLRDLRAGAFLPARDARSPFPLTGRARIVSEMTELRRTLDAIESAPPGLGAEKRPGVSPGAVMDGELTPGELAANEFTYGVSGGVEAFEGLSGAGPTLPGRAARSGIEQFVSSFDGQLVDASGRRLVGADGEPIKLGELLWLGTTGGPNRTSPDVDPFPTRLSPLLIYGFDALYSLLGFDGRTLAAPRYAAVEVQINASELEWVFGQPPLSEGYLRALIERLKDAAPPDQNVLGETLELALAEGRLYTVLLGASVEEGVAAPESYTVTRLLPATSDDNIEFAPA